MSKDTCWGGVPVGFVGMWCGQLFKKISAEPVKLAGDSREYVRVEYQKGTAEVDIGAEGLILATDKLGWLTRSLGEEVRQHVQR